MDIGFIGLGKLGEPIARRVLTWCQTHGCRLYVFDATKREAMERLKVLGAREGVSAAAIAERCTILFSLLPGPEDVIALGMGENGILRNAEGLDIWFELSPFQNMRWDSLREQAPPDLVLVDAPISGGVSLAQAGNLSMALEGAQPILQRYQDLLSTFVANCKVTELTEAPPSFFRLADG
ncbi:NAD(P)-binding domain-containing protein [Grimontia sp. NTOU-MAR1]|uniref:NAD(P)-binding domain-containing protein n=1 Tax=Grimontia sp. NTOU-MAR1 TaxID=3111011 RepID=UPI002DBAFF9F|nr:NAD(P)-binding domain-containing protein [Grimontia sp. NTOU-MAR1]WRW00476.1 NAD(P)-binding domain-containing protein [Grimontia sp. NTOU-MAR1]